VSRTCSSRAPTGKKRTGGATGKGRPGLASRAEAGESTNERVKSEWKMEELMNYFDSKTTRMAGGKKGWSKGGGCSFHIETARQVMKGGKTRLTLSLPS